MRQKTRLLLVPLFVVLPSTEAMVLALGGRHALELDFGHTEPSKEWIDTMPPSQQDSNPSKPPVRPPVPGSTWKSGQYRDFISRSFIAGKPSSIVPGVLEECNFHLHVEKDGSSSRSAVECIPKGTVASGQSLQRGASQLDRPFPSDGAVMELERSQEGKTTFWDVENSKEEQSLNNAAVPGFENLGGPTAPQNTGLLGLLETNSRMRGTIYRKLAATDLPAVGLALKPGDYVCTFRRLHLEEKKHADSPLSCQRQLSFSRAQIPVPTGWKVSGDVAGADYGTTHTVLKGNARHDWRAVPETHMLDDRNLPCNDDTAEIPSLTSEQEMDRVVEFNLRTRESSKTTQNKEKLPCKKDLAAVTLR